MTPKYLFSMPVSFCFPLPQQIPGEWIPQDWKGGGPLGWAAHCCNLLISNSLLSKTCSDWGLGSLEKKKMCNLLLSSVLLSPIIVLIIHCYCLRPSTRTVQCEFRKIACEEGVTVRKRSSSRVERLIFLVLSVGHSSSAECCRITYWIVYQRVFYIWEVGSYIPLKAWGEMLGGERHC